MKYKSLASDIKIHQSIATERELQLREVKS